MEIEFHIERRICNIGTIKKMAQLVLYLFCFVCVYVNACGFNTHNEIAHRAYSALHQSISVTGSRASWLSQLLQEHQDAFQGGGPFPDWGYLSGYGDAAEAAHWEPFINV
jgi:hypothetical protein